MASFGDRLAAAMAKRGPLCVGIDPHPTLLESWQLPDTAAGARDFARITLEAVGGHVGAVKPQSAFFERHGSAGMAVLEEIVHTCKERGVLCIVDAKRGDIGSTMAGYADAFLREGGPFAGDALTLSPYLGVDSLAGAVATAQENARGVFLLALTSNPEGAQVQHARTSAERSVAAEVAAAAARWNADTAGGLGDVGLVVGATVADAVRRTGVDLPGMRGPLLVPGIGAQGGQVADLADTFGAALPQVLVSTSREILGRGPDPQAMATAASELSTRLGLLQQQRA